MSFVQCAAGKPFDIIDLIVFCMKCIISFVYNEHRLLTLSLKNEYQYCKLQSAFVVHPTFFKIDLSVCVCLSGLNENTLNQNKLG